MIRPAYADDYEALAQLAALDSADGRAAPPAADRRGRRRPAGRPVAAKTAPRIADPFFPTAGLLALLRAHAGATAPRSGLGRARRRAGDAASLAYAHG